MKKFIVLALSLVASRSLFAISMNFNGSLRNQATLYDSLDLGTNVAPGSKTFIESRALLEPNLIVDDHFSVHSQWNLLNSKSMTPDATTGLGLSTGQGGYILGDP